MDVKPVRWLVLVLLFFGESQTGDPFVPLLNTHDCKLSQRSVTEHLMLSVSYEITADELSQLYESKLCSLIQGW